MKILDRQAGQLIRISTADGLQLEGFDVGCSDHGKAVIHVHGLSGNFYEHRFLYSIAATLLGKGWGFLSTNNRGHDYVSDIMEDSGETIQVGGNHEVITEANSDIDAWIEYLKQDGCKTIVLEGHSLGCLKVIRYAVTGKYRSDIRLLIFISPADIWGLQRKYFGEHTAERLKMAGELVLAGRGSDMMPADTFSYPIDARSFVALMGSDNYVVHNSFAFSDLKAISNGWLPALEIPSAAIIGSADSAVVTPPEECLRVFRAHTKMAVYTRLLADAPHNYWKHEGELAESVAAAIEAGVGHSAAV